MFMKKVALSLFFGLFFIHSVVPAAGFPADAGNSSLSRYSSRSLKDYPALILAQKTPYFETYWSFERCHRGACGSISSETPLNGEFHQKNREAQNFIEQVLFKRFQEFDQWAQKRLPFWNQRRDQVFPVAIFLEPFPENSMAPSAAVVIQEFEYVDKNGIPMKRGRRPTISVDLTHEKSIWSLYSPMLTHEFGHVLLYSFDLPQYLSPLDEAFADLLMLSFHPGASSFLPELVPSSRKALTQGLSESVGEESRQFFQETLRLMSKKGIRDFAKSNNPRFPEIYLYLEVYFISSMVNTTFNSMSSRVRMERWTEAFLTLLQEAPQTLLDLDLSSFMSALLQQYQAKHPHEFQENKSFIKEKISKQRWQRLQEIPMSMELSEFKSEFQKRKLLIHLPAEKIPAIDQNNSKFLIQLFGGGKIIGHAVCKSIDKCKKIKFVVSSQNSCVSSPCSCFTEPVSLGAQFLYLGTDGKIRKSEKDEAAISPLQPGCYWASYE